MWDNNFLWRVAFAIVKLALLLMMVPILAFMVSTIVDASIKVYVSIKNRRKE